MALFHENGRRMLPTGEEVAAQPPRTGFLARLRERFDSAAEADAERALHEAQLAGLDTVASVKNRRKVRLVGFISSVVIPPAAAEASVEVDVYDGTGTITVIWIGRRHIEGIEPGSKLRLEGFAARRERKRVMYNPRYTLLSVPGDED
ncbi:hypothetical protein ACUH93_02760 [Dermabacteraceae bacterium P7006]